MASTDRFGMLLVNDLDRAQAPLALPTHFTVNGDELLLHLARPNPLWPHLEAATEVRLAMIGDCAYIPYDDHNRLEHRERVIDRLEQRSRGLDPGAATQQRRRLAAIGDWQTHRSTP